MSTPPWPTTIRVTPSAGRSSSTAATGSAARRLGGPWRCHELQAGPHLVHAGPVQNRHVVGAFGGEQRAGVHRRRVQRIMVAGQQVHRNTDGAHGFQRLAHVARRELVVFEDVARDDHEFGPAFGGQRPQAGHDVAASGRISRLRLTVQEVTGHAELPVGGVHESHLGPSFLIACLPGIASVGPGADKSGDVCRHALRLVR